MTGRPMRDVADNIERRAHGVRRETGSAEYLRGNISRPGQPVSVAEQLLGIREITSRRVHAPWIAGCSAASDIPPWTSRDAACCLQRKDGSVLQISSHGSISTSTSSIHTCPKSRRAYNQLRRLLGNVSTLVLSIAGCRTLLRSRTSRAPLLHNRLPYHKDLCCT